MHAPSSSAALRDAKERKELTEPERFTDSSPSSPTTFIVLMFASAAIMWLPDAATRGRDGSMETVPAKRSTRHTTHDTRHTTHDTRHTTHDTRHTTHLVNCDAATCA
jgi:hypothetical protein